MWAMSPEVVAGIMEGFAGYDLAAAFRNAGVSIRAAGCDLCPTDIQRNRTVAHDFDAVVMTGAGQTRCPSGLATSIGCSLRS